MDDLTQADMMPGESLADLMADLAWLADAGYIVQDDSGGYLVTAKGLDCLDGTNREAESRDEARELQERRRRAQLDGGFTLWDEYGAGEMGA